MEEPTIDQLLTQCHSDDPRRQVDAILQLRDRQAYDATPDLVQVLASQDVVVRSTAAEALGYLGKHQPEIAGPALMSLLADSEPIVRSDAVDALGLLGYTPAAEVIRRLLRTDPEPLVRASAAESLGDLQTPEVIPDLEVALQDPDEAVRGYAANSIGLLGRPELISQLETYLRAEPSTRVQAELLGAQVRLGATHELRPLLNLLDMADEEIAPAYLNVLADLLERQTISLSAADVHHIKDTLTQLAQRHSIVHGYVERILRELRVRDTATDHVAHPSENGQKTE